MSWHDKPKHDPNKPVMPTDPEPAYPPDPADDEGTGPGTIGDPPNEE